MHNHSLILLEAGAAIKEVQNRLGHTDVQTTMNIYAHITKKQKQRLCKNLKSTSIFDYG